MPISDRTVIASGWTKPAGLEPALATSIKSPAALRRMASARWLRQELPVQRMSTRGLGMSEIGSSKSREFHLHRTESLF